MAFRYKFGEEEIKETEQARKKNKDKRAEARLKALELRAKGAEGLGLSQNRRVSGQRLCLLILQISISADRDVPAFSKAGTFFLLRYLKNSREMS